MSYGLFVNYLDGKRQPESWNLDLTEFYKTHGQITVKMDRRRPGHGQVKFIIPEADLEHFIEELRRAKSN